ncbi:MAG: phosphopantetheine-binding protein [Bacteroidales bacterium]|nr:phosphopantetheine-binding protein [Bacteroidales bacterium]
MEKQILEIINTVLSNRGKATINEIHSNMKLREDIGFDSLDLAELTVRIEAMFNIDIFEDGNVNTIGEILTKLSKK